MIRQVPFMLFITNNRIKMIELLDPIIKSEKYIQRFILDHLIDLTKMHQHIFRESITSKVSINQT